MLALYRKLNGSRRRLPAPWWLRALDRGELPSRAAAFELEDEVHGTLLQRAGWVFVPWTSTGETGFWEYGPSDRGAMKMPTTVTLTDQHEGWVNVIPAHADHPPRARPLRGTADLRTALPDIESW